MLHDHIRLELPKEAARWTLQTIQANPVKTGRRLVRHARQLTMQMFEHLAIHMRKIG